MKALNLCGMFKSTSSPPSPSEEFLRSRRSIQPLPQDAPSTRERDAACQAYKVTRLHHHQLLDGMEYAHFPQQASGSTYIHAEPVPDLRNFKLKKQVKLNTVLTKELYSITEEVELWQEKYEEALKTILKLQRHCPTGVETLSDEDTEEFTPAS
jgi:hypothetical protein